MKIKINTKNHNTLQGIINIHTEETSYGQLTVSSFILIYQKKLENKIKSLPNKKFNEFKRINCYF